ncbi:MAG: hypothetical protein ACPL7M_12750 [Bryobacteraceae bacterium]
MAALPLPKYGLEHLFLFPVYPTREKYREMTGEEPPPFDPNRPAQYWRDPEAMKSTRRVIIYDRVLATDERGYPKAGPDGKPYFEPLALPRQEAATVNIPPKKAANEQKEGLPDIQPPCRELEEDEELAFDFGGIVVVRNKNFASQEVVGFTVADRELLRAIAKKLNVNP